MSRSSAKRLLDETRAIGTDLDYVLAVGLTKLDFRSRAQIAAWVAELGR